MLGLHQGCGHSAAYLHRAVYGMQWLLNSRVGGVGCPTVHERRVVDMQLDVQKDVKHSFLTHSLLGYRNPFADQSHLPVGTHGAISVH